MTDSELIELLAAKGMGWDVHDVSAHRPGSRALPHVWKWRRAGGVRFMVYDGKANREWNPLTVEADAVELAAAMGIEPPAENRREIFEAAITKEANPDESV